MKRILTLCIAAAAMLHLGLAKAEGELFIYNWTEYTPPELIAKFEKETGIKVSVDTYDSNETLLAKLQAGATGYDIVVPSQKFRTDHDQRRPHPEGRRAQAVELQKHGKIAGNFRNGTPSRSTPDHGNGAQPLFPTTASFTRARVSPWPNSSSLPTN